MDVCGSRTGCSNIAYPTMVLNLLPAGSVVDQGLYGDDDDDDDDDDNDDDGDDGDDDEA